MRLCTQGRAKTGRALAAGASLLAAVLVGSCALFSAQRNIERVFLSEGDTIIAETALPVLIKASEVALAGFPHDRSAAITTASLYVMYASAFVIGPADLLPDEAFEEKRIASRRAEALFKRASRLLEPILESRAPGILSAPREARARLVQRYAREDVPLLYWSAAALLGAFSVNPLGFGGAKNIETAMDLLARADELAPGWNGGAIDELFMNLYASLPPYLGGSVEKAEAAYARALAHSNGTSASVHVSYALALTVPRDDYPAFKAALTKALALDPDLRPESRLANTLAREKAEKLLAHPERYFFTVSEEAQP